MKDVKQASLIAALVVAGAFGCSSSNGSNGTGGSNGNGGSTGSGGHLGTGGTKACGGPAPTADAGVCQQAPCDGLIADFSSADAGIPIMGGLTSWSGILKPTYTLDNGTLNVMEDVAQSSAPQYLGTTLYFNNCVDASAFSGVQFTISGSVSAACQVIFGANDVAHDDKVSDPLKGKCDAGSSCYAPNMPIPMAVTSTPQVMQIPWITGSSVPDVALDPAHLVGVQWQFTVGPTADGGTPQNCTAELHIDDVKFY
ncbi:MAG TPA: hypothetical protein VN962_15545 [Polyangia bacterium]|nr:hypothetical protein [Polyangia bacterium]